MNFLLLAIQSIVCIACVYASKRLGVSRVSSPLLLLLVESWRVNWSRKVLIVLPLFPQLITFRDFDKDDARKWFPISFLLVLVIYTGSKSLVR